MQNLSQAEIERLAVLEALQLPSESGDDFNAIARVVAHSFDVPIVLISKVGRDCQEFLARVGFNVDRTPRESSICAYAIQQNEIMEVEDLRLDKRFSNNDFVIGKPHMRFYAGIPIIAPSGHAIGALCIIDFKPRRLTHLERERLSDMANIVMNQIAFRQSVGRRDAVTGLANRHQFVADLKTKLAPASDKVLCLVLIEAINLAEAHDMAQAAGLGLVDSILRDAARIIKGVLLYGIELYHVGVTRFAICFDPSADLNLPQQIFKALSLPIIAGGLPIQLNPLIGIVEFDQKTNKPDDLLRKAMIALRDDSQMGNALRHYEVRRDDDARRRYSLALDLGAALKADEFELVFQPRVSLSTGVVTTVEALIRWRHPRLGLISPAEFIPIVERTALMQPLTLWVIRNALIHLKRLHGSFPNLRISLNLSPRDFDNGLLPQEVAALCAQCGIAPRYMEFEVTEGEWLHENRSVREQMNLIVSSGCTFAIDDFGSGYSNFAYMNRIPATVLKIDQSLIRDMLSDKRRQLLVLKILELAQELNYTTVGEGVETLEVLQVLLGGGCDEVQGYFLSRPIDPGALESFIRSGFAFHEKDSYEEGRGS